MKTKIKKAIAIASIAALTATTLGSSYAAVIGTASITGGVSNDVIWDNTFPGTATGTTDWIVITAKVLPTLNMTVSTGSIDLGTLTSDVASTGSLDIEIGTNAAAWVVITARSWSGGLTNTADNAVQINDLATDGNTESYTFGSAFNTVDSTIGSFVSTGDLSTTQVNDNSTEHTIYSTNKPELDDATNADVTFDVATTSNAQTAAWDYQDTITFTVTGNF